MLEPECRGMVLNEAAASVKSNGSDLDDDVSDRDAPPPPPTPLHTDPRGQRNKGDILESLLEISLDNEEGDIGGSRSTTSDLPQVKNEPSAARTMLELKDIARMRQHVNVLDPVPSRGGFAAMKRGALGGRGIERGGQLTSAVSSALEQATASFGEETGSLAAFERMQRIKGGKGGGKGGVHGIMDSRGSGRKAVLSSKARQRRIAGSEKEEAYNDKLNGRMVKHNKRKERMERLRRMY
ncbi:hypothetical protein NGA_0605800 [Nannochloropsis gaditana CCMP526]|uniref:Uncharacterized protein n=1 Tax=Nannochloropsis gaditana TaxID=72520 RepID=W7U5B5_9STRA|nr:hypothetical protein NGA_0605800 [Nannochloropsis gaditana CCMP526]EKU20636.1 hypothetical protein NGA_0605800 [Nannochloropsis gaditana CCMP526]EWM27966.1 hypothetical protein Naga_100008g113 [Nannochloropsis gaditana]|eukprot:XP_005855714.1 hypothetical protein NGA_0605800 [Nannochloropsis gaditana CCMP526]